MSCVNTPFQTGQASAGFVGRPFGTALAISPSMGFFNRRKHTDERPNAEKHADTFDPAPWLGQVGDGHTLESGERIARELRELRDLRHRRHVDADAPVSADPEMPIPDPDAGRPKR